MGPVLDGCVKMESSAAARETLDENNLKAPGTPVVREIDRTQKRQVFDFLARSRSWFARHHDARASSRAARASCPYPWTKRRKLLHRIAT